MQASVFNSVTGGSKHLGTWLLRMRRLKANGRMRPEQLARREPMLTAKHAELVREFYKMGAA